MTWFCLSKWLALMSYMNPYQQPFTLALYCFWWVFFFLLHSTCRGLDAITIDAIWVSRVSIQRGCADHTHDVGCTKGERHPVLTQPLTEVLCLTSKLLQLVFVLKERCVIDMKGGSFQEVKQFIWLCFWNLFSQSSPWHCHSFLCKGLHNLQSPPAAGLSLSIMWRNIIIIIDIFHCIIITIAETTHRVRIFMIKTSVSKEKLKKVFTVWRCW